MNPALASIPKKSDGEEDFSNRPDLIKIHPDGSGKDILSELEGIIVAQKRSQKSVGFCKEQSLYFVYELDETTKKNKKGNLLFNCFEHVNFWKRFIFGFFN